MRVREYVVSNWFGRWMRLRKWGDFSLPTPWNTVAFYWVADATRDPPSMCYVHDAVIAHARKHAEQRDRYGFVRYVLTYVYQLARYGYRAMPIENECRAAEKAAKENAR